MYYPKFPSLFKNLIDLWRMLFQFYSGLMLKKSNNDLSQMNIEICEDLKQVLPMLENYPKKKNLYQNQY